VSKAAGGLGLVISGAGPTLCALCSDEKTAMRVTVAMHAVYAMVGIACQTRCTQIASEGARIV
jgi:homoserine kinase